MLAEAALPVATGVDTARPKKYRSPWRRVARSGLILVLAAVALFFAIPVIWLLLATTKTQNQTIANFPLSFGTWSQIARNWSGLYAYEDHVILVWMRNSAIYCVAGTVIAVVIGIPAGYALAVTQFVGRRALLSITLIVMLIPGNALVLPIFLGMNDVHLIGNAFSVILPFGFFPFGVYLAYIYFNTAVPENLLAAARVDGCSEWRVFRHVAAPLALPVIGLVAFFNFVGNWNNYFLPFVMLQQTNSLTTSIGLQTLLAAGPGSTPGAVGQPIYKPELALGILIMGAPIVIVFIFAQRMLVRGLLAGATKE
jgi:multiple sugar transport system permease protein